MATATAARDERLRPTGLGRRLLSRPELSAVCGAVAVFAFFASYTDAFATATGFANVLDPAATLGIMAVVVALLMIGGEFDLSAGVMTASSGLLIAILSTRAGLHIGLAIAIALVAGALVGLANGLIVVHTGLPSFIVTLGTFLVLQGLNLGITKLVTGTVQVGGLTRAAGYHWADMVLASTVRIAGGHYRVTILWWLLITAAATWVLLRTRPGNWIFAVGGGAAGARNVGVPTARTKIFLFMTVSTGAALVGAMAVVRLTSMQANAGIGQEFQYIIAAVIGGCLLTGGYGSAVGAAAGALIFGMAQQGIVFAGWDSDWFMAFLGTLLLIATLLNHYIRRHAERAKR
ncbi:ABC transporter permease [Rhizomonospora bruguierae]|uniref:ABC transporter permease n=1 Tax=Rhizomonospora bruguierae TaxID=1581705 RepID=UPI001BCE53B7|nr:ABC transporter permease [Micromonospora sp. NBRC 107566]